MKHVGLVLLLSVLGCACVSTPEPVIQQESSGIAVVVEPEHVKELCFEAMTGNEIMYRFEASATLGFNLHYHTDEQVFYPVPEHETTAEKGRYIAPADQVYCLMWTNNGTSAAALSATLLGVGRVTEY